MNHLFGNGEAQPLATPEQEQQKEFDIFKAEKFWDKINLDLLSEIINLKN